MLVFIQHRKVAYKFRISLCWVQEYPLPNTLSEKEANLYTNSPYFSICDPEKKLFFAATSPEKKTQFLSELRGQIAQLANPNDELVEKYRLALVDSGDVRQDIVFPDGESDAGDGEQTDNAASFTAEERASSSPGMKNESGMRDIDFKYAPKERPFTYSDGSTYFGLYYRGMREGPDGNLVFEDESTYIGDFRSDMRWGSGFYSFAEGSTFMFYDGGWKEDLPHGRGVITYTESHLQVKGLFVRGVVTGAATVVYQSGEKYEGGWRDGMREGCGTFVNFKDEEYEGFWHKDRRHGQGIQVYATGRTAGEQESARYEGEWHMDVRHGKGMMTYPNGDSYVGQWENDLRHGNGTYTDNVEGFVYVGLWMRGMKSGKGELKLPNRAGVVSATWDKGQISNLYPIEFRPDANSKWAKPF